MNDTVAWKIDGVSSVAGSGGLHCWHPNLGPPSTVNSRRHFVIGAFPGFRVNNIFFQGLYNHDTWQLVALRGFASDFVIIASKSPMARSLGFNSRVCKRGLGWISSEGMLKSCSPSLRPDKFFQFVHTKCMQLQGIRNILPSW